MKAFRVNKNIEVICQTKNTRNGFKHVATLLYNGNERGEVKICYQNRTWERYEYESVLEKLAENTTVLSPAEKALLTAFIKNNDRVVDDCAGLKAIAGVMALGDIFGRNQKEKNDWKERMLRAGLENKGLIMPDDWNELDEDTKQARLDGAIGALS